MYKHPSTPRSIGGVLDDTIQLYKASFASCWLFGLLMGLVSFGFSLYVLSPNGTPLTPTEQFALMKTPTFLIGYLLLIAISLLIYGAVTANVYAVSRGEQPGVRSGLATGLRVWLSMFFAGLVFAIIIVCGLVLLILPGIYLMTRLQLWPVAVVGDRNGPMQSLGTSWRLVQGHWWRTFTVFAVLVIIAAVVFSVFGMLAGFTAAAMRLSPADALVATQGVSLVATVFTIPAFPSALVAIYHDLKLRKEGGDLAARMSNVQPA